MATIPDLIAKYIHFRRNGDAGLEFELRFDHIDFETFRTLVSKLLATEEIEVTVKNSLNTIRTQRAQGLRKVQIWEREFLPDGGRATTYYSKETLVLPIRVRMPEGMSYRVVLSQELPIDIFPTNDVIFRLKSRFSFQPKERKASGRAEDPLMSASSETTKLTAGWRVDATLVRTFPKSSAPDLKDVVDKMFATRDPNAKLAQLGLYGGQQTTAASFANQQLYTYELELEYVGEPEHLTPLLVSSAVSALEMLVDPDQRLRLSTQTLLYDVATNVFDTPSQLQPFLSGERGLKQLTPNPETLTRATYAAMYPPVDYYLTRKPDGFHAIIRVKNNVLTICAPGHSPPYAEFPAPGAAELTIIDGELIPGKGNTPPKFLAFDLIVVKNKSVAMRPYEERYLELPTAVKIAAQAAAPAFAVRVKEAVRLESPDPAELEAQFRAMLAPVDYESDGLILIGNGESYTRTTTKKWKPFENNTIDFLARRPPPEVMGHPPFVDEPGHRLFFLFVGISRDVFTTFNLTFCAGYRQLFPEHERSTGYFPVQFQPSDHPYAYLYQHPLGLGAEPPENVENRIIELALKDRAALGDGLGAPRWSFVRLRIDRDDDLRRGRLFGNNFQTAEIAWLNFEDTLTFEMLYLGAGSAYFQAPKIGIYSLPTNEISAAKSEVIQRNIAGMGFVVDLGAGKGQDLGRYRQAEVAELLAVDQDPSALSELVRRKYTQSRGASGRTRVHVVRADFTDPFAEVNARLRAVPSFPKAGADALVCNLAAHYAFSTPKSVQNFVQLLSALLRKGGQAILTLLSGQNIMKVFNDNKIAPGESWDLREGGVLKYSIRKLFRETTLTEAGQKIGVLLPFSRGELYEEYLTNVDHLVKMCKRASLKVVELAPLWDESKARKGLTDNDASWLKLFILLRVQKETP